MQGWVKDSNLYNSSVSTGAEPGDHHPGLDPVLDPGRGLGLQRRSPPHAAADPAWSWARTSAAPRARAASWPPSPPATSAACRVAGGKTLVGGAYLDGSQESGDWLFAGGLRIDYSRSSDAHRIETTRATGVVTLNSSQPDKSEWLPSARLGVRRNLSDALYLRTAAYAGFRPATLNELHRPFRVGNDVTEANLTLKPERLYGVEAGLGGQGVVAWNAVVFYNRLQDQIANVTLGAGPGTFPIAGFIPAGGVLRQRQNAGRVDAWGVEGDAAHRWGGLTLRAAASYVKAEIEGGTAAPQLTGLRPAQTPRFSATGGVGYEIGKFETRLDLRYESARFDDDQNIRLLRAGTTLDARIDYKIGGGAGLFLAVENLGDANIQTARAAERHGVAGGAAVGPGWVFVQPLIIYERLKP